MLATPVVAGDTLSVLDRAVYRLGDPSSNYRTVLLDTLAALPSDAGESADAVRADVRTFLARAPEPGSDFKCSLDFVRARARLALLRIRDTLRKDYVGPVEPAVCYATPYALDVTRARTEGGWLDIYGYDFDRVTPEMILVGRDGYRDVTAALVAKSHFHLALRLGDSTVPMAPDSVSLGLTWRHIIHHSIAIVQPTSSLCAARVETIPSGRTISLRSRLGAAVRADATLDYSSNKLEATVCMAAANPSGQAVFSGCSVEFLHTTDPDWIIEAVLGAASRRVSYVRTGRGGGDVSVTVRFDEITFVSVEDNSCVSPLSYMEARRRGELDSSTTRSLDPQLERVDSALSKLRPRFTLPAPD